MSSTPKGEKTGVNDLRVAGILEVEGQSFFNRGFTTSNNEFLFSLSGDATGNNSQGDPVSRSTPFIVLSTAQVSEYRSSEDDKGGYSELIRLKALTEKAKPTLSFYDYNDKPVAWLVAHWQPQDLLRYATLADFPATGENDGLVAYYAIDTETYYTWNTGTSQYDVLDDSNSEYYYRAIHQHVSVETADATGSSNFTRLAVPYGLDVVPITTSNAHFRVTGGTKNSKPFGAFIVDEGKMFSLNTLKFFPNNPNAGTVKSWEDVVSGSILDETDSFDIRFMENGSSGNLAGEGALALEAGSTINYLQFNKHLILGAAFDLGLGMRAGGVKLDIRDDLGVANAEHTIGRWSRTSSDGFMTLGYKADGSILTDWLIRGQGGKGVVIGTTGNSQAVRVVPNAAKVELDVDTLSVLRSKTPASASAIGATGDIAWDSNYVYVCVATNTWKRTALSTW